MARLAREENEALKARIEALEAKLARTGRSAGDHERPARCRRYAAGTALQLSGHVAGQLFRRLFLPIPAFGRYKPARLRPRHPWRLAAVVF